MTREKFHDWMDKIIQANEIFEDFFECKWVSDNAIDAMGQMLEIPVSILQEEVGDKEDWIPFWLYELSCGKSYEDGCAIDKDGNDIPLKTIDDLYNVIMEA